MAYSGQTLATLAQPSGFDPFGAYQQGQDRKMALADRAMAQADQQAARNEKAKASGIADHDRKLEQITRIFKWADTPEKLARGVKLMKEQGYTFDPGQEDFANRDAILGQAMSLKEQMAQSNSDRTFGLQERNANRDQSNSDRNFNADENYRAQQLENDRQKASGQGAEYGLNPIWGTGPDGKPMLFQTNKAGGPPSLVQFPENFVPDPGVQFLDTGLNYTPANKRTGLTQPGASPIPKNVEEEAAAKIVGKEQGEAKALYLSLSSKMPGLQKVVDDLGVLADEATYTTTGQLYNFGRKELGMAPTDSAVARSKYIATVDNQILPMLRDTFGAAFTVEEGKSLRSTLGDPDKTPQEKKAVLNAFIEQKIRNLEASGIQGKVNTNDTDLEDALREYK